MGDEHLSGKEEKSGEGQDDMQIDYDAQVTHIPQGFNADYLRVYYGKLFPYAEMFKWLSCGHDGKHPACDSSYFGRREFSFTLEHDIYIRFQSFQDAADMENSIKEKCPHKIDIGAVYNVDPAKRHAYAQVGDKVFSPVERELVFDIDMTDYDDVRYCCSGADVCVDCWHLMTIAIKVIDTCLREDFGFEHILWVYSGRRGVHCWVCDGRARRLTNEQRAAIASYFRVYKGGENSNKMVSLSGPVLHPSLTRAYADVLRVYFEEKILPSQKLFSLEDRYQKILDLIPDDSIASQFREKWRENRRSSISKEDNNIGRWKQLRQLLESGKHRAPGLRHCIEEIVFSYTYPRLDMEVSKHMNHLLKAPFCIHPKTGCVCVPINPDDCENFDPTSVPTLSQALEFSNVRVIVDRALIDELDIVKYTFCFSSIESLLQELNTGRVLASGGSINTAGKDWEKTSLANSVYLFRSVFLQPFLKYCRAELESAYNSRLHESGARHSLHW